MIRTIFPASAVTLFYNDNHSIQLSNYISPLIRKKLEDEWSQLTIRVSETKLHLNRMRFAPGNKVAVTKLQIYNYLKGVYGSGISSKEMVSHLLTADYSLGMIFDPDIAENDTRLELGDKIIKLSRGVFFNGETLFNSLFEQLTV